MSEETPNINWHAIGSINEDAPIAATNLRHTPRILLLYGSLRQRLYSRLSVEKSALVPEHLGADVRLFIPSSLPLPNEDNAAHPKSIKAARSCKLGRGHGLGLTERPSCMPGVMKLQIDWIPLLLLGGIRPTQSKAFAVMQVCGGS